MSLAILEKMFGSSARVRIMKLFLFNPESVYEKNDVIKKTKIGASNVQKELNLLENIRLIKKTSFFKEVKLKSGPKKKRTKGFILNNDFIYLNHLKSLLIDTAPLQHDEITKKISKSGKVKLIVASGIFVHLDDGRVDLLVVGDAIKEKSVKSIIHQIEAEIGKEIRYAVFSTDDFKYRLGLSDHLIKDVFDYPHRVLIDKIGL